MRGGELCRAELFVEPKKKSHHRAPSIQVMEFPEWQHCDRPQHLLQIDKSRYVHIFIIEDKNSVLVPVNKLLRDKTLPFGNDIQPLEFDTDLQACTIYTVIYIFKHT